MSYCQIVSQNFRMLKRALHTLYKNSFSLSALLGEIAVSFHMLSEFQHRKYRNEKQRVRTHTWGEIVCHMF